MRNFSEALRELSRYGMRIRRHGYSGEFIVHPHEDRKITKDNSIVTDDLDDCVILGVQMRQRRLRAI